MILNKVISFICIMVLSLIVYNNTISNDFVCWDDDSLIVNRIETHALTFENMKKIFRFHRGSTYQPLRTFSYAIDYYFSGMDTLSYHVQNIIFHTLSAIILYFLLLQILPLIKDDRINLLKGKKYE